MDSIDLSILECLKADGRATASQISRQVSLSVPAVAGRIRKLEQGGVIEKYTVKLSRDKTGLKLLAFILVSIDRTENAEPFTAAAVKFPCVLECHHIAGEYDYLLKVLVEDARTLDRFLAGSLKKIRGVVRSNTIIALSSFKEELNP